MFAAAFRVLSIEAAALILARWIIENPDELVAQSRAGFALQNGQTRLFGLVASTFGRSLDFATTAAWHTHGQIDRACPFQAAILELPRMVQSCSTRGAPRHDKIQAVSLFASRALT